MDKTDILTMFTTYLEAQQKHYPTFDKTCRHSAEPAPRDIIHSFLRRILLKGSERVVRGCGGRRGGGGIKASQLIVTIQNLRENRTAMIRASYERMN